MWEPWTSLESPISSQLISRRPISYPSSVWTTTTATTTTTTTTTSLDVQQNCQRDRTSITSMVDWVSKYVRLSSGQSGLSAQNGQRACCPVSRPVGQLDRPPDMTERLCASVWWFTTSARVVVVVVVVVGQLCLLGPLRQLSNSIMAPRHGHWEQIRGPVLKVIFASRTFKSKAHVFHYLLSFSCKLAGRLADAN